MHRFNIPLSDEVDDLDAKKDPLLMKAVKAFKANYVSPIQLRYIIDMYMNSIYKNVHTSLNAYMVYIYETILNLFLLIVECLMYFDIGWISTTMTFRETMTCLLNFIPLLTL